MLSIFRDLQKVPISHYRSHFEKSGVHVSQLAVNPLELNEKLVRIRRWRTLISNSYLGLNLKIAIGAKRGPSGRRLPSSSCLC